MFSHKLQSLALLAATVQGQFATYSSGDYSIAVNVPSSTAQGSGEEIYFQLTAPSDTRWMGVGQGSSMTGSNMFIIYASGDGNVTVSPRLGEGNRMPQFNADGQVTVLEGTGVQPDGSLQANIRCDSCLTWDGGSMEITDNSSPWIMAWSSGSALNTPDTSASIAIHDSRESYTLDLTQGTGGTTSNPFVNAASDTGSSASPSGTDATAPIASSTPNSGSSSSSSSSSSDNTMMVRRSHAIIMSLIFLFLFPVAALTLYLPYAQKVRHIHAPLQTISLVLLIIGLATGVVLGQRVGELDAYHQIIGYLIVAVMILFQPALGIYQHLHYRKTGGRSPMGIIHRWLGRCVIILGVINGGLGFMQAGPIGNEASPSWAVIAYCIVAGVIFFLYLSVILAVSWRNKHPEKSRRGGEKKWGYEMNGSQGSSPRTDAGPQFGQGSHGFISNPRGNPTLGRGARRDEYR